MKKMLGWMLAFAVLMLPLAMAAPQAVNNVSQGSAETYTPTTTSNQVSVQAGNTYETNLSVEQVTQYWAGLYGNIDENIILGSGSAKFYQWPVTTVGGYVYAATGSTIDWANLSTTVTTSDVNAAIYAQTNTSWTPDSDETLEATFSTQDSSGTYCSEVNAYYTLTNSYDGTNYTPTWPTCVYKDATNNQVVFESKVTNNGTSFKGTTVDYQTLVPALSGTGVTYYIFKA